MVTRWRDCWVTKPQDKTKKAGSSFLSKLGGGNGGGGEEGGEKCARKGKVRVRVGLGLGLGFGTHHAT